MKLLGSIQVWLFNHKNKQLTCLNARTRDGIDIKGQTFKGVDINTSTTKRIGRKTNEVIKNVLKKSKPQCKKILQEINAKEVRVQTRSNASTIILRVF